MTEGPLHHEKPMCVRIWLEVGHACAPRRSVGRAPALDWRVWVRGARGDISALVHKVVFHLHPSDAFVYPKRVIQEPPYEIQESGCASIEIPIHVYLKHSSPKPKRIRLRYSLRVENGAKSSSESRHVYYDVENPSEALWAALMRAGGEVVARVAPPAARGPLVVRVGGAGPARPPDGPRRGPEPGDDDGARKQPKYGKPAAAEDVCAKCGESTDVDFRKQLRSVAMTDDEIQRVSRLYAALSGYEKSSGALALPPLGDPIYRLPEPSLAFKAALSGGDTDYCLL